VNKATAYLTLTDPYIQSRYHETPKLNKELANDYEKRTWKNRLHVNQDGIVVIPGRAFSNSLAEAAKFISLQIPGKGKSTYTKHFESGVQVIDDVPTGVSKEDVIPWEVFVPSNGIRGAGTRVMKTYPMIYKKPDIQVKVVYNISDDMITAEAFAHHLQQAGNLIGIGAFRVRNNGSFGRYHVDSIDWEENQDGIIPLPPINIIQKGAIAA
jgi:hypothetical protein